MFTLDKDKYPFPPMDMDKDWLDKKIKLDNEVDYSVYAEPITIDESLFKNRVQNDADVRLRFMDEIKYLNKKIYVGSHSRLSDDEPYVEFIVHAGQMSEESSYGLWVKANSKNLKPIMKYKGNRKVKARLRKKKSICVGYIDKDGCYHIGLGSPSFKGIYNFFSRSRSYNKKLRKIRKFKRR